jgi:hypothetical protein
MRQLALAIATITVVATISAIARADMVGAAAGAGSGLVVAGPAGQLPVEWSVGFLVSRSGVRRSVTAHAGSTTTSNALLASSSILSSLRVDWNYGLRQLCNIRRDPPRLIFAD